MWIYILGLDLGVRYLEESLSLGIEIRRYIFFLLLRGVYFILDLECFGVVLIVGVGWFFVR